MSGLAGSVLERLRAAGQTLATAESLTGGLVCAALTDVPGSSAVVRGAVVAYAVDCKSEVLGVPAEVLAAHGAVSAQCALAMARGARSVLAADWAVATTGVAGPGPSPDADGGVRPAGTVHVAVAGERGGEQVTGSLALHLDGSREEIRTATVQEALGLLLATLDGLSERRGTVEVPPAHEPGRG